MVMMDMMNKFGITEMMIATQGIRWLSVESPKKAQGKLKEVYAQITRDLALATPLTLHSSQPDLVAGAWSAEREVMFHGIVPQGHKEAVATAVSIINECPYCIDAHTIMMSASDEAEAAQVLKNQSGTLRDVTMQALVDWAKATRTPGAEILLNPPFSEDEAPEIIGAALAFHYINRMVTIFSEGEMMPDMGFLNQVIRKVMSATVLKTIVQRNNVPGDSLKFLPEADLPDEFSWAENNEIISKTFAGITEAIATHITEVADEETIITVQAVYDSWQGEDKGISRAWVNQAVAELDESQAIAGKLMLLAGIAPYQISETDIDAFRKHYPDDGQLIAVTAWGAWTAVRRISTWLHIKAVEKVAV